MPRRRRSLRGWLLAIVAVLALGALAPTAAGHAVLVASDPAPDTVLPEPPGRILLTFSEPTSATGAEIVLIGPDGEIYASGDPYPSGRTLMMGVPSDLPAGTSLVDWRIVSADGHRVQGSFTFSVGSPSAPPSVVDERRTVERAAAGVALRTAIFTATVVLIGLVGLLLAVWRPLIRRGRQIDAAAAELADRTFTPIALGLGLIAGILLALLGLLAPPLSAWALDLPLVDYLALRQGRVDLVRFVVALLLLPVLFWGITSARRRGLVATLPLLALLAVLPAIAGHASAGDPVWLVTAVDGVHVVGAGLWGGGILVLAVALPPVLRRIHGDTRRDLLLGVIRRFTQLAVVGLVAVGATGVTSAVLLSGDLAALPSTPWGRLLIGKLLLVAGAIAIAAVIRRTTRTPTRGIVLEAGVIFAVLVVTGLLTGVAPRAEAPVTGPYAQEARFDERIATVDITPALAGIDNEVHVIVVDARGRPAADVTEASVTLSLPDRDIRGLRVDLVQVAAAHWSGSVGLPLTGTWDVETRLVIGEFREEVLTGTMDVGSP